MIKSIQLLVFFLMAFTYCKSQKVDDDSVFTNIRKQITSFFVEQGYLNKTEINDTANFVFAYEIVEKKMIGYNKIGIYRIGVLQSHSKQHILIKEGNDVKIFDLRKIDLLFQELLNYRSRQNIQIEKMVTYFSRIIELYEYQYIR